MHKTPLCMYVLCCVNGEVAMGTKKLCHISYFVTVFLCNFTSSYVVIIKRPVRGAYLFSRKSD